MAVASPPRRRRVGPHVHRDLRRGYGSNDRGRFGRTLPDLRSQRMRPRVLRYFQEREPPLLLDHLSEPDQDGSIPPTGQAGDVEEATRPLEKRPLTSVADQLPYLAARRSRLSGPAPLATSSRKPPAMETFFRNMTN